MSHEEIYDHLLKQTKTPNYKIGCEIIIPLTALFRNALLRLAICQSSDRGNFSCLVHQSGRSVYFMLL